MSACRDCGVETSFHRTSTISKRETVMHKVNRDIEIEVTGRELRRIKRDARMVLAAAHRERDQAADAARRNRCAFGDFR